MNYCRQTLLHFATNLLTQW